MPTYASGFLQMLEAVYDAVVITDEKGNIRLANARCADCFGYSADELGSGSVISLISGADVDTLETICRALKQEHRIFIEGFCTRKDETVFPAEIAVSTITLHQKKQLVFIMHNIAVSVETEEASGKALNEIADVLKDLEAIDAVPDVLIKKLKDVCDRLNKKSVQIEQNGKL